MAEILNATCDICGKKYHVCKTCEEATSFKPWRTITDTMDHYKIFMVLSAYTKTKDIETAREDLKKCNLEGKEKFNKNIKKAIDEILSSESEMVLDVADTVQVGKQEKAYKPVKTKARKNDIEQ